MQHQPDKSKGPLINDLVNTFATVG